MRVRLNCYRGAHRPGEVVELDDSDAAALLPFGGAHPDLGDAAEQLVRAGAIGRFEAEDAFGVIGSDGTRTAIPGQPDLADAAGLILYHARLHTGA